MNSQQEPGSADAYPSADWDTARLDIITCFRAALGEDERIALLRAYHVLMESILARSGPTDRSALLVQRWEDYNRMLVGESCFDTGRFSARSLFRLTSREIEAGRMARDDELHETAAFLILRERAENYQWQVRTMLGSLLPPGTVAHR